MFINYINYSFLFFKLWGINKLLLGIPYYIIEHLILHKLLHITYKGSTIILLGVGSGIYYLAFDKPITALDIPNDINPYNNPDNNLDNFNLNSCDLDDKNNNHLDMYKDT